MDQSQSIKLAWKDITKVLMTKDLYRFGSPVAQIQHVEDLKSIVVASANGEVRVITYSADDCVTPSASKRRPLEFKGEFSGSIQQSISSVLLFA
jgi:DUF971 family protein